MTVRVRGAAIDSPMHGAALVAAAGSLLLLARPFVAVQADARLLLFGFVYVAIASASAVVPVERAQARVRPAVVLVAGLVSVVVAAAITAPPVPAPYAALALPTSLLAAVAEEALFRRVAYARLARFGPFVAVVGSAILFAAVHLPGYGVAALPVDLGAGVLFGWQRWASGTWLVPAATHASANAVAILW